MNKKKRFFWPVVPEKKPDVSDQVGQKNAADIAGPEIPPQAQAPVMPGRRGPNVPPRPGDVNAPRPHQAQDGGVSASEPLAETPVLPYAHSDQHSVDMGQESVSQQSPSYSHQSVEQNMASSEQGEAQPKDPAHQGLLVLENITRVYKQADETLDVLNEANLAVHGGEMVALVAPSGAGKSTLLHIAGLLERPNSGEVYVAGRPQSNVPDRTRTMTRRCDIGFVYQFHHLLPEFSALENVLLPQMIAGGQRAESRRRAIELLRYLKVDHRAEHRPSELSGGEQQRVALARAMANAPRVLLADEPTGNLDPNTSEYVFRALNSLVKQSGIAALVATHNLFLAERMDRQITLVDGRITEL